MLLQSLNEERPTQILPGSSICKSCWTTRTALVMAARLTVLSARSIASGCVCIKATALVSPPFFGFLFGCSSTFQCGNEHSAPNLHSGGGQYSHGDLVQVPFKKSGFCLWHFFLDTRPPRVFGDWRSEGGSAFGVGFARSLLSCRKLHWSPFEHCPFSFHW